MIALFLGAVSGLFLRCLRFWQGLLKRFWDPKPDADRETKPVPPLLMGFIERLVFSSLVWWVGLTGATITGMFAWLALKMATNWTRPRDGSDRAQAKVIRLSQGALLAGAISLLFAAWGGLVARGEAWPCAPGVLSLDIASTIAPIRDLSAKQRRSLSFRARQAYRGPRVWPRGRSSRLLFPAQPVQEGPAAATVRALLTGAGQWQVPSSRRGPFGVEAQA